MSEATPLIRVATDTGTRWGFDYNEFDKWWRSLPKADVDTFIHYGGDELLMRFVCAFDWLQGDDDRVTPARIADAYAAAASLDPKSSECLMRAGTAFKHPAVQEMIASLSHRDVIRASKRIMRKYTDAVEQISEEMQSEEFKNKLEAIDRIERYAKLGTRLEAETSAKRERHAAQIRAATPTNDTKNVTITETDIRQFISTVGVEKIAALLPAPQANLD